MLSSKKYDRYGQELRPGDICARSRNDRVDLIMYKGEVFGSKTGKGEFGRFITPDGPSTLKYTSVVFAFDPLSKRRANAEKVKEVIRQYYEGPKR